MLAPTEEARADFLEVAKQVGEEFLWNPKTLGTLRLGVLWKKKNVHAGGVELKVTSDGEGGDAAAPDQPNTDEGNEQPITIVQITLLAGKRQAGRFVHHLQSEI